jgi:hypothetical protein
MLGIHWSVVVSQLGRDGYRQGSLPMNTGDDSCMAKGLSSRFYRFYR